eukprot:6834043-Alexandrium_andersonii.AAC.1
MVAGPPTLQAEHNWIEGLHTSEFARRSSRAEETPRAVHTWSTGVPPTALIGSKTSSVMRQRAVAIRNQEASSLHDPSPSKPIAHCTPAS